MPSTPVMVSYQDPAGTLRCKILDGSTWRDGGVIATNTDFGPSALAHRDETQVFFVDKGDRTPGHFGGRRFQEGQWHPHGIIRASRPLAQRPCAATFRNELCMIYQLGNGNLAIDYGRSFDAGGEVPNTPHAWGASAVEWRDQLYVFYRGHGTGIWYNVLGQHGWLGEQELGDTGVTSAPSAVVYRDAIHLFHQGYRYNGELWCNVLTESGWGGDRRIGTFSMSDAPSAVVVDDDLYVFHQGYGENRELWYTVPTRSTEDFRIEGATLLCGPSAAVIRGPLAPDRPVAGEGGAGEPGDAPGDPDAPESEPR